MKAIKKLIPAVFFSVAAVSTAQAGGLDLYASSTTNGFDGVDAKVYMDGKPVKGATVQLLSNGGTLRGQQMTDEHGRAEFDFVGGVGSVVIKASANGLEEKRWVNLDRSSQ